jgi:hypothetical protein
MSQTLTAPDQMALAHAEDPHIYESGDCWRFRWAGQDHGSFDSEHSARSAAHRFKQQTMMKFVAAALHLR